MARNRKRQSQRYYYQNCLKPPITVDGVTKHIELPYPDFMSIPVGPRFYVGELIKKWGYNVQYKLLSVPPSKEAEPDQPATKPGNKTIKIKKRASGQLKLL